MQSPFLNIANKEEIKNNWIVDMQVCAYLRSLDNKHVQYK